MGKKILYITNYYLEDVVEQRNSAPFISQAGQNKSSYMIKMFQLGGNDVTVWSNAWTDSRSGKYYKGFQSKIQGNVFYSDIIGVPLLNVWACKSSCKKFIARYVQNNKIDAIVFYNMRMENTPVALWAKKKWNLPIFLQYEDGLTQDATVSKIKRILYRHMEKKALPMLDGAFLVNSKIQVNCPSVVIRGAIQGQANNQICENTNEIPMILFASTLDEQRGIKVVLEALKHTNKEFELYITGRGPLESFVTEYKDHRLHYLGYLDYEAYQEKLQQADICVNAQLAHCEFGSFSFPSKISEYISNYKLVVSSDVADVKEALGKFAFIYENDNPQKLAEQIDQAILVYHNPQKRKQYQENMQCYINENAIEIIAQKANQLFEQATGGL